MRKHRKFAELKKMNKGEKENVLEGKKQYFYMPYGCINGLMLKKSCAPNKDTILTYVYVLT